MKYKGSKLEEYINSKVYLKYMTIDMQWDNYDDTSDKLSWITFTHNKYGEFRFIPSGNYIRYEEKSNIIFKNIKIDYDTIYDFLSGNNKELLYIFFNAYLSIKKCNNIYGNIIIDFQDNIVFNGLHFKNKVKLPANLDVVLIMSIKIPKKREIKNKLIHILRHPGDDNIVNIGFNKKTIGIFNDYNKLDIDDNEFLKNYSYVKPIGEINARSAPVGFFTHFIFYMLKVKNTKENRANIRVFIYLYRLLFKNYYRRLETVIELDVYNNEVIISEINKKTIPLVKNRLIKNGY